MDNLSSRFRFRVLVPQGANTPSSKGTFRHRSCHEEEHDVPNLDYDGRHGDMTPES